MAKPDVTFTVEPAQDDVVTFLPLAPTNRNKAAEGQVALLIRMRNNGAEEVRVNMVELTVFASSGPPVKMNNPVNVRLGPRRTGLWHTRVFMALAADTGLPADTFVNQNLIVPPHANMLNVVLRFRDRPASDSVRKLFALRPHRSPTPEGAYAFPAKEADLRQDEFWNGAGAAHGESVDGCQLFALDVGVSGWEADAQRWNHLMPRRKDGVVTLLANKSFRVWEKPVYAMAAGRVVGVRWDFPDNPRPCPLDERPQSIKDLQASVGDGNGNFLRIETGDEVHLYAHFKEGTVPRRLRTTDPAADDVRVEKGELLGLVGNSGNSTAPHLHFGALRRRTHRGDSEFVLRPMPFAGMRSINSGDIVGADANAPWFEHAGHGLSRAAWPERCLIWPLALG